MVCTAEGVPRPSIQWYKDDVTLKPNDSLIFIYNDEFENNGLLFTTSSLGLCSVGEDDIGNYSCQAMNSAGRASVDYDIEIISGIHKLGTLGQFSTHLLVFRYWDSTLVMNMLNLVCIVLQSWLLQG